MKINFRLALSALCILFLVPCVTAQVTIVKQEGNKIYLDTSEYNRKVSVGDTFKIILSQEKLTNPKTGKDLGLINHYSEEGKIVEVQALYAVGQISVAGQYAGKEAVLENHMPAPVSVKPTTTADAPVAAAVSQSTRKATSYQVIEREVISAVKADLLPFPDEEIAVLDKKGNLALYSVSGEMLQEQSSYTLPVGHKPLSLSAVDVMNTGYAQLFVAVYQEQEQKISTWVFDVQNKEFVRQTALPYFVKELGCAEQKEIYAQKPFISSAKPGEAHKLAYEKGRFSLAKDSFATRGNWLTGINEYEIQNEETENFVYTAYNGVLRMRLNNGKYIDSPDQFATAPNRIKYTQKIIPFYPSIQVYGPKGHATLAAIENTSKLGILSEQFGQYNGGKLHFLSYQNGRLAIDETVELSGFAYDTNCTARGILIPQVLSSGQTILTEIYR
ncbi:MAG: hypothetical protein IKN49_00755 [Elusimicrobiaceae bacterium]|nr:hypothetical protein [Elusimicrobiaceae bacterium]